MRFVGKFYAFTASAFAAAVLPFLGSSANAEQQETNTETANAPVAASPDAPAQTLAERQAEGARIIAELKKVCDDPKLIENAEVLAGAILSEISDKITYINNTNLGSKALFVSIRDYLSEDLAGRKDRVTATETYAQIRQLSNCLLGHTASLAGETTRNDTFGNHLTDAHNAIYHLTEDLRIWAERSADVQRLSDALKSVCSDKELVLAADNFLRGVVTLDINNDRYIQRANEVADTFFEKLGSYVQDVRNGKIDISVSEWQAESDALIDIMNRSVKHTKDIGVKLPKGDAYREQLSALNQSMIKRGREIRSQMLLRTPKSDGSIEPPPIQGGEKGQAKKGSVLEFRI